MKCPIKSNNQSTLCFAFFVPVVCALMLCAACSDSSDITKNKQNNSRNNEVTRLKDNDSAKGRIGSLSGSYEATKPTENAALSTQNTTPDRQSSPVQTSTNRPALTLPESIDWSIPEEKVAAVTEKIAADNDTGNGGVSDHVTAGHAANSLTSDAENDTSNDVPDDATHELIANTETPEQASRNKTANPFAVIEESTVQTTATETESTGTVSSEEITSPTDDVVDKNVWEQAAEENHGSFENVAAKQPENNGTIPNVIRNELQNKRQVEDNDIVWEAAKNEKNNDATPTTSQADSQWQAVPNDQTGEPTIKPNIDTATLPNVQNDDDLFGMEADAAAEQFGETFGPDAQTTSSQSSDGDGFGEGFGFEETDWDDFGSSSKTSTNGTTTGSTTSNMTNRATPETQKPIEQPKPQTPAAAPASQDQQDAEPLENMTKIDEYLINEAKISPVKLMESVELLHKLNKPLLVRRLLRQFVQQNASKEDCLQIHKRVSPAVLLRLSVDEQYQPDGANAVRKIIDGAKSYYESRSEIEKALRTLLSQATDRQKEEAVRVIMNGRETAIEFLLERLKKSEDAKELSEVMGLLLAMGDDARRALQESLMVPKLGMHAARLLTQMGRASDSRFLLPLMFDVRLTEQERGEVAGMVQKLSRKVPKQQEAAEIMYGLSTNYFNGKVPFMTDENNNVPVWVFREGNEVPVFVMMPEEDASRHFAEKFSRYATCLDPARAAYRQFWLVTYFDLKGADPASSDNSILQLDAELLQKLKTGLSIADVESVLRMAMQQDHPIAARVAAELMGEFDDAEEVLYRRGSQNALVRAAGFSDRRVRFAALNSIMKLNPERPYPGSSVVTQSLVYFTRATGKKRAVVVCPWASEATSIANYLAPLGYTTETATMGRQAMQLAIDSADTELMMLDVRTPNSDVAFLIQDMRADNRTHDVPIAVIASSDQMTRAQRAAFGSKMAHAFSKPHNEDSVKFVVDNLMRETGVEHVPPQIRLDEALHSIRWVTALYQRPNIYRFENIEQIAFATLWEPELTAETLKLVELIPSAAAQQMMTHIVSTAGFPIETRQAALNSFEKNAQSFGILIRGRQILDLYDAYNASGAEPVASQTVRNTLLDVIEARANYMQNVGYQK